MFAFANAANGQTAIQPRVGSYSQISAISPSLTGFLAIVTDCLDASCTAGGGSLECVLVWDGSAWGAAGCGGTPYAFPASAAHPVTCSSSFQGSTFYDTTLNVYCYCSGVVWRRAADDSTLCTSPAVNNWQDSAASDWTDSAASAWTDG